MGKKQKHKVSEYRKYNAYEKVWIPYFYIMYHYWWRFLKIAYEEKKIIRWKFYKGWGGKEMFDVSFRTWWKYHYKQLFVIKDPNSKEKIRFPMTTDGRNKITLKTILEVYKFNHIDLKKTYTFKDYNNKLTNNLGGYLIYDKLCKRNIDSFFTTDKDMGKGVEIKVINKNIKRHRDGCKKILDNVCVGKFP